jgi:hypothetical protein
MNMNKLHDDLTEEFIEFQWRLDNPFPAQDESRDTKILKYRSDNVFHLKVKSMVCGVMHIISKHV